MGEILLADALAQGNSSSIDVTLPGALTDGDRVDVAFVYNQGNGDLVPATPADWTLVDEHTYSGSMRSRLYRKVSVGNGDSNTTHTFSHPSANKMSYGLSVVRGAAGAPTVLAQSSPTNAAPSIAVGADSFAVSIWLQRGGTITSTITPPAGFTTEDYQTGSGGGQTSAAIASNLTLSDTSVGGGEWDPNVDNNGTIVWTLAYTEGTPPPPPDPTPVNTLTYPAYIAHRGGASVSDRAENTFAAYEESVLEDSPNMLLEADCAYLGAGGGATDEERICLTHAGDDLASEGSKVVESDGVTVVTGTADSKTVAQWDTYLILMRSGVAGSPAPATRWYDAAGRGLANILLADPNRIAVPEVKEPGALTPLINSVIARNLQGQVIAQSFDYTEASTMAAAGLNTMYLTNSFATRSAASIAADGIGWVGVDRNTAGMAAYCTEAHAAGLIVFAYTVNDTATRDSLLADGVDGFFTDRPTDVNDGVPPGGEHWEWNGASLASSPRLAPLEWDGSSLNPLDTV